MAKIKKDTSLRKAILQAAITGQLISDVEGETETGKQLLDRIIEERKNKLSHGLDFANAKSGKRKSKKETALAGSNPCDIPEDEIPFEIPENWYWCRLGDLIQIKSGDGLTSTQMKDGSIPVYGGNGITGYHNDANIHEETIVIGRVGFYCGSVHLTEKEAWVTDNAFISNYSKTYLNRNYLITALRQLDLGKQQNKTAQPVVSGKKIYPMLFPLPPLAVQNAIVAKLEEVLPFVDAYENVVLQKEELKNALPDTLKKAILQEAIQGKLTEDWRKTATIEETGKQLLDRIIEERNAKLLAEWEEAKKKKPKAKKPTLIVASEIDEEDIPFEVPDSWCWCRIDDIFAHNSGKALNNTGNKEGIELEYITTSNLYWNYFELNNLKTMLFKDSEIEKCTVLKGDLLICEGGEVGRSAIWNYDRTICIQNHIHRLRAYDSKLNVLFYYHVMYLFKESKIIDNYAKGIGIKGLSSNALGSIVVPLPPLAEQKKIVEIIEQMLPLCEKLGG